MKRIGVVTTSRADYGIYLSILEEIRKRPQLELQLFVTGMHLCPLYGNTVRDIERDGFDITARVDTLLSDTPADTVRAMGRGTESFARVFAESRPDILLVLGDRFEMHAAAVAAIPFRIPIAHIHGGELTFGAMDEYFRHSLTKLSDIHFAATEDSAARIRQMGEPEDRVFVVGAPALDRLAGFEGLSVKELEERYHIDLSQPALLVTYHPVTMEPGRAEEQIQNLLRALEQFPQHQIVFTQPNADPENGVIAGAIRDFLPRHAHAFLVENFGPRGYFSMMKAARAMVGNSSSGIIEAASFRLPVVNIGTRQEGRVRTGNIIDVGYSVEEIEHGLVTALSDDFRDSLKNLVNPYGTGQAGGKIVSILEGLDLTKMGNKKFRDIAGS